MEPIFPLHILDHVKRTREILTAKEQISTEIEVFDSTNSIDASEVTVIDALLRPVRLLVDDRLVVKEFYVEGSFASDDTLRKFAEYGFES